MLGVMFKNFGLPVNAALASSPMTAPPTHPPTHPPTPPPHAQVNNVRSTVSHYNLPLRGVLALGVDYQL